MNIQEIKEAAKKAEDEHQWLDAAFLYDKANEIQHNDEYISKAGWCYSRAEKYEEAIKKFLVLQVKEPNSAKWPYMVGYQYYCTKNWGEAAKWYESSLEKYPDYFIVKYRLGYTYLQIAGIYKTLTKPEFWRAIGQFQECRDLWLKFSEEEKNKNRDTYADVCFQFGKSLMQISSRIDESIAMLKQSLELKKNEDCQYELAKALYQKGNYVNALNSLPNSRKYYVQELTCMINYKMGDYEIALRNTKNIVLKRRKDYLYILLSRIYVGLNDIDSAYVTLRNFVQGGCDSHKLFFEYAGLCNKKGFYIEAKNSLEKAISIRKDKYSIDYPEAEELMLEIKRNIELHKEDKIAVDIMNHMPVSDLLIGTISKFRPDKGYGFIKSEKGDHFFHISNCNFKDITIGNKVKFISSSSTKGLEAKCVELQDNS